MLKDRDLNKGFMRYVISMEERQNTNNCEDNTEVVDNKQSVNTDKEIDKQTSDKELTDETMKRDIVFEAGDGPTDIICEKSEFRNQKQTISASDSTLDYCTSSREGSDCSDYDESSRCQLTNQALRAKLLNSVINPITDRDSKLRVSVFDHRIIPKRFISKSGDNRNHVDTGDIDKEVKHTKSQENINENNCANNKREATRLSHSGPPPTRRQSSRDSDSNRGLSGSKCSENGSKMDNDYEIRTRFDILLRNLIGDVDNINVESSPITVSSGYESDYIQGRDSQKNNINNKIGCIGESGSENTLCGSVQNVDSVVKSDETPTDYFTMSETYPPDQDINCNGAIDNQEFSSLPVLPTQYKEQPESVNKMEPKEVPVTKQTTSKPTDRDFGFFYAQRQNYKLTKVTRSMYEIIHDLQNGEKVQPENKKRSRKGRRQGQDSGSDGNNSPKDTLTRGRLQAGDCKSDNNTLNNTLKRTKDSNSSGVSGSVVRCVRRPQFTDAIPRPAQRRFSQSENEGRLSQTGTINSDKVQNDLRNLLCDTSDVTESSVTNNDRVDDLNMLSSNQNTGVGFTNAPTSTGDNGLNQPHGPIIGQENKSFSENRKPSLNEQFNNRPKPDDHVYETIPGDEKFYEEWKKMRAQMPRIRRFTTIPDLPGTFIPKDPPALPARKYLHNTSQVNLAKKKDFIDNNDNYIVMGDINSNFPTSDKSDSGYTTVSSDQMLVLSGPQCFPYPMGNTSPPDHLGRNDETSDGYCSIDNLSLIREQVDSSFISHDRTRDWRVPDPVSVPPPPRLKRSDFFLKTDQQTFIQNGFSLFHHEHTSQQFKSKEVTSDRRRSRENGDETNFLSSAFEPRNTKHTFQATYV